MKNTIKRTGKALTVLVLFACLAGCGKKQPSGTAAPATAETAGTKEQATENVTQAVEPTAAEAETGPEEISKPEEEEPVRILGVYAGTVSEQVNSSDSYYPAARVVMPELELSEESRKQYPELDTALKAFSKEVQNAADAKMTRLTETYTEMAAARQGEMEALGLCDETSSAVLRADSRVLSIRNYSYAYYGGPHPDHSYSGENFDTKTGKRLKLADVVVDSDAFTACVEKKVREEYPDLTDYFFSTPTEAMAALETENCNMAWNLEYEGIRLIFNPYCLGPYAMGEQTVMISFAEAPELFNEYYARVPDSWFMPMDASIPMAVDAAGKGKTEVIAVTEEAADEEGGAMHYSVKSGNRSCLVETYAYKQESYLLKANGQYYVYLFTTTDNDWVNLYTVDLRTMLPAGDSPLGAFLPYLRTDWYRTELGNAGSEIKQALTDPGHFRLGSRVDYLGTQDAYRDHHVGGDGTPVPETEYYCYGNCTVLKVKLPIEAEVVNENGEVTGTEVLSPGTYLSFVRTDDNTYADLQEVDDSKVTAEEEGYTRYYTETANRVDWTKPVYRIRENKTGWPFTIGEFDESEVLGGINYAG